MRYSLTKSPFVSDLYSRSRKCTCGYNEHNKNYGFKNIRYKIRSLADNDYFCISKIAVETNRSCRNIVIPAGDEKIVQLLIVDDVHTLNYLRKKAPAVKEIYFHDI